MPAYFFTLLLGLTEPLQFGTNLPTTAPDNAVNQVECILFEMGAPFQLQTLPWLRARREVKLDRLDGYFTTHLMPEMKAYGRISSPIFLESWYWFTHPESINKPKNKMRYGAVRGSYQANWFKTQNIIAEVEVNSLEEIVNVMHHKRIDRILLDLDDFELAASKLGINEDEYQREFFRYVPLGLFASHSLIKRFPKFMQQFDENINTCAQAPFSLSKSEEKQILDRLSSSAKTLLNLPSLVEQVQISNESPLSESEIKRLDQLWIKESKQVKHPDGLAMLNLPLSKVFKKWQSQFKGVVTELILTDNQGKNIAISKLTSDYWQGDENKFTKTFKQSKDFNFDSVTYDASTHHFQVQLSFPVLDDNNSHIGVLILGVDVEKALHSSNEKSN
ncbi:MULTISPECIES: cache domain-containing protein [Pseudoalteromonas]|uniref:cache domain-containing protein n=1 Tax=Pseudoalteromonas TaxID=53246 RepID=UPI000C33E271|nr:MULTISPECIES: cache domain-containing protein [Pseudoalteromonas]MBH0000427.1 cache domain-containing protein [Pseudoalteromonas sp. NSLLW24]MBH0033288.1 cache domain-containing protein [Pseudoalteromonas sp. NZS71_1]PKG62695.1 cellulose-binding family II protein [Pseudoalteromonas arctica]PKG70430.1 cellulose-binding family II protein [Pseudoalteromonas sp. GutCa3]